MGISVTIGGIFLYKSYAYYEEDKEYNVIKGIIPDFSYDVKFAVTVDGEKKDTIPKSSDTKNNNYYRVTATCDNGEKAEWDYNAWSVKVNNLQDGTKCKLAFTSDLSKEELDKYIEAGVVYRRNTYRGKDITSKLEDGTLFSEISSGHFDDIYVGDYIKSKTKAQSGKEITWLIADIDNYMYTGQGTNILKKHHVTIIPAGSLMKAQMNTTNTTVGGYAGSAMVGYQIGSDGKATTTKGNGTLDTILNTYINPDFGASNPSKDGKDHVIEYTNTLSNGIRSDELNKYGNYMDFGEGKGASTSQESYSRKIDLLNELNVFGTTIVSSGEYDTGIDTQQYAIFKLNPKIRYLEDYPNSTWYWLLDVTNSTTFAYTNGQMPSGRANRSDNSGEVRPRFLID